MRSKIPISEVIRERPTNFLYFSPFGAEPITFSLQERVGGEVEQPTFIIHPGLNPELA
ncbi:hypothetical protein [Algoriphagus sp. Y33]|uniref:hypothetical protein n=1 Tax=Algoriphagus sp. Y33 TaxID=2772483 RepID=UPI001785FFD4|nr:hypothetical protein [Algoriphagus sp. Y33]